MSHPLWTVSPRTLSICYVGLMTILSLGACAAPEMETKAAFAEPKGLAVCIGADELSKDAWKSIDGAQLPRLQGAAKDAGTMAKICDSRNIKATVLTGTGATVSAVQTAIANARQTLGPGDMFVLSFAGHGTQSAPGAGGPEEGDKMDEAWCLFDGKFVDNQIRAELAQFNGVRVILISDSCHAGTMTEAIKAIKRVLLKDARITTKDLGRADVQDALRQADAAFRQRAGVAESGDVKVRALPPSVALASELGAGHRAGGRAGKRDADNSSGVQYYGACKDAQLAYERGGAGVFTSGVDRAWNGGRFDGNYALFFSKIQSNVSGQSPVYKPTSAADYNVQQPFSLTGEKGK